MADLPPHHYFTRWWLRRYPSRPYGLINRVVLRDRALGQDVGAEFRYPEELNDAIMQLKQLRARDHETIDQYIFNDGLGDV